MRIAWFAPAGYGEYSRKAARELVACGDTVEIAEPAATDDPAIDRFAGCDLRVYNFGGDPVSFHTIYDQFLRRPGLVILHEWDLAQHLRAYFDRLSEGARRFRDLELMSAARPLFAPALWGAFGAVVHAEAAREVVAAGACCPVEFIDDLVDRSYADRFRAFAEKVRAGRAMLEAADGTAHALADIGVAPDDPLVEAAARRLAAWAPRTAPAALRMAA